MVDADDVRRVALRLPHVAEIDSDGFDFRVGNRGFVWSYPERQPGRGRVIRTDIAVLYVGDEAEKQALLLGEPDVFFTTREYDWYPLVMVRLDRIDADRLVELVTDAWRMRAPDRFSPAHSRPEKSPWNRLQPGQEGPRRTWPRRLAVGLAVLVVVPPLAYLFRLTQSEDWTRPDH